MKIWIPALVFLNLEALISAQQQKPNVGTDSALNETLRWKLSAALSRSLRHAAQAP